MIKLSKQIFLFKLNFFLQQSYIITTTINMLFYKNKIYAYATQGLKNIFSIQLPPGK